MWINYSASEVGEYHPICEKALNDALGELKLKSKYEVKHHQMVGSLEMDFAIRNKSTGRYLCVVEVKRTPRDVQSARYQYQAMSYVQMAAPELEKPFYIVTNLEYSYSFRYDASRPRVFQQMLNPGLIYVDNFSNCTKIDFMNKLTGMLKEYIEKFINDDYEYLVTLDQFAEHMSRIKSDHKNWKSSLAILLYEYIRGAFLAVGRSGFKDVRVFSNDVKTICDEAINVNFKGIFEYNTTDYLPKIKVDNQLLSNLFDFGKQNISADTISDVLHGVVCDGQEHSGKVSTDTELARLVVLLAKYVYGNENIEGIICDPAAGSGSLISTAIDILGLAPNQIMANDIDPYLIELLSLRLGLNFPRVVCKTNAPTVKNKDIADMVKEDFDNTKIILLNPPYVAGINCTGEKQKFSRRIKQIMGKTSITNIGQVGLEGIFVELVTALVKNGTVISCIMPKQYLVARGNEAVEFRKFLVKEFGLEIIFNYPGQGLFNPVTKDTCVLVGKKGTTETNVKVFTSLERVQDIDLVRFNKSINEISLQNAGFSSIMPGIEALKTTKSDLLKAANDGWRILNSELYESIEFVNNKLIPLSELEQLKELGVNVARGQVGNNGASDLLYFDSNEKFFNRFKSTVAKFHPGMRNALIDKLVIGDGDSVFLNYKDIINDRDLDIIVNEYIGLDKVQGKQTKKDKTADELKKLMSKEAGHVTIKNSVLIPRNLRATGRVYINDKDTYVSTNFVIVKTQSRKNADILASWVSTIFYQLICEVSAKDQEGKLIPSIQFVNLQTPIIREIDKYWARVLFDKCADDVLMEAQRLLKFVARKRNSIL